MINKLTDAEEQEAAQLYQELLDDLAKGKVWEMEKEIPLEELIKKYPSDICRIAKLFNHPVIEDENGVWRWKTNKLIDLFWEGFPVYTPSQSTCPKPGLNGFEETMAYERSKQYFTATIDLNKIWSLFDQKKFELVELMRFYMGLGYSLSGFGEVFGQKEAHEFGLPNAKYPESKDNYTQNLMDYVLDNFTEIRGA